MKLATQSRPLLVVNRLPVSPVCRHRAYVVGVLCALVWALPTCECGADDAAHVNKIDRSSFEECLAWLPVDTETLRVRRDDPSHPLQDEPRVDQNGFPKLDRAKWGQWAVREIATPHPLDNLRDGKHGKQCRLETGPLVACLKGQPRSSPWANVPVLDLSDEQAQKQHEPNTVF